MITPVIARPAATIMLLRDQVHADVGSGDPRLEVLLLRRSGDTPFVPGAHVFPGGAVDAGDRDRTLAAHVDGLDDITASRLLGVASDGLAFWIAAIRECLEEAGILVAADDGALIDASHDALGDLDGLRSRIEYGDEHLAQLCADHGLRLPLGDIVYVSRWITPEESPRRYDTRFFAAAMPAGQHAVADDREAVDASWWHPPDALAAWQAEEIQLIQPTVASLELLTGFDSCTAALTALRGAVR